MTDAWDERKRAQEDSFFEKANQEVLARLARKQQQSARLSPVTGTPMEAIVCLDTVLDRCATSGGLWFDKGELEHLVDAASSKQSSPSIDDFINHLPKVTSEIKPLADGLLSPISGKPMRLETISDITIARCQESGGIWLDGSELHRLMSSSLKSLSGSVKEFFSEILS